MHYVNSIFTKNNYDRHVIKELDISAYKNFCDRQVIK
jgi:hypothetical protein